MSQLQENHPGPDQEVKDLDICATRCAISPSNRLGSSWSIVFPEGTWVFMQNGNPDKATVQTWSKSPLLNRCGLVALLGLAVCVFAWGLQYKLSLYDPPQTAYQHIPQAKLLSRNEQTGTKQSPAVIRTKTATRVIYTFPAVVFLVLLLVFNVPALRVLAQKAERANPSWRLHCGLFHTFFVRPPPFLI